MSKGIDRTVEQLFNFKFGVFRSNLRLHWFSIGLRFRDEDMHNSCKEITKAPFTNEEGFSNTVEYWKIF
jgi:hypothetical protein